LDVNAAKREPAAEILSEAKDPLKNTEIGVRASQTSTPVEDHDSDMKTLSVALLLLSGIVSAAQTVAKEEVLQAASEIQKAVEGTDQLRLRVNRYCHITITHEPEEALLRVISTHVLSQKHDIPASEMLYVIRASVATEAQLLLWSGDCAEAGARADDEDTKRECYRLASQLMGRPQRSLHEANERFWDLLAKRIGAEELSSLPEQ